MKVCMVVPEETVKGGIASVVNGYRQKGLGENITISYVESYRDGSKWQKLGKALKAYVLFRKEIRKNRPDIVHIHSSFGPSFYRKMPFIYMANKAGIPIVNHIHGAEFDVFYEKASDKKRKRIQIVYNKCHMLIALSKEWEERLSQIVPAEKICIIENYCMIPKEPTRGEEKILFLGEISKRKGCLDIPKIYHKYCCESAAHGVTPWPLVMAGDGPDKEIVEKVLSRENVRFTGWVRGKEKDKLLESCGLFLFPSYNEGMPMAILEAMAYGMAILTTNVGGIPKLIEDGFSGFLCEPGSQEIMVKRLLELTEDTDKRRLYGMAAREKALHHYSYETHRKKMVMAYEKVVQDYGQ